MTTFDILFRSRIVFQLGWYSIDRQVLVHQIEETRLQLLEQFFTHFADKSIVVLVLHVHDEFHVSSFSAFRQCLHFAELDAPLELVAPNIANLLGRQEQVSGLLHPESVVFDHLAREDNVLVLI